MKKRTCKPFYDKTCQRLEARAAHSTTLAAKHRADARLFKHFTDAAVEIRKSVATRILRKRRMA